MNNILQKKALRYNLKTGRGNNPEVKTKITPRLEHFPPSRSIGCYIHSKQQQTH